MSSVGHLLTPPRSVGLVTRTDSPILHEVVEDAEHWLLFEKKRENLYVVGSVTIDQYLVVPESKLAITLRAVHYLDGSHEFDWIHKQLAAEFGQQADLVELFSKLRTAGLVRTAQIPGTPHSEVLRHSVSVFDVKVGGLFNRIALFQALFSPYAVIAGLIFTLIGLRHFSLTALGAITTARAIGSEVLDYAGFWCGLLLLALIHECFHGFAAVRYGLRPARLSGALYLGFIPYIFIRIPGIYTLPPRQRLVVWSAGVYANLLIGTSLFLWFQVLPAGSPLQGTITRLIWANVVIVLLNLSPFMATDGYFLLSTLLKTPNIRTNAYLEFKKWIKGEKHNFSMVLATYFAVSIGVIAWFLVRTIIWLEQLLSRIQRDGWTKSTALEIWPLGLMIVCAIAQGVWNRKVGTRTV